MSYFASIMRKNINIFLVGLLSIVFSTSAIAGGQNDDDYDRLDGMGKSGKKVNVIEWENNLEIHIYPKNSLSGLGLKLDKKNKDKPVMVISYRFDNEETPLIRRAILGIKLDQDSLKVFKMKTNDDDYDKFVITNGSKVSGGSVYKLDHEPKYLYPEGHPLREEKELSKKEQKQISEPMVIDSEYGSLWRDYN